MYSPAGFEVFIFVLQSLLLVFSLGYVVWGLARSISAHMDVPFVPTPKRILPIIASSLDIQPGDVVYDLGCGDGRLLFYCAHRFPRTRFIGIERNTLLIWYANAKKHLAGRQNIQFRRADIFGADFLNATKIYAFLLPHVVNKLFADWRPQHPVRLVSRAFTIQGKSSIETIPLPNVINICGDHELHVYEW